MTPLISPSILSADFANLQSAVEMLNKSQADWIHVDVMDGVFVPNISFGFPVVSAINQHARKPLDVHLMIVEPDRYIQTFKECGAEIISVHAEACTHLHRTIQEIKRIGCKAGVAINPHTPISVLDYVIQDIDLVCVMSVNPGFGGQKFIPKTIEKIKSLSEMIKGTGSKALIEVDGGVNDQNAKSLVEAGADILVAGSFVFSSQDPVATIAKLKS